MGWDVSAYSNFKEEFLLSSHESFRCFNPFKLEQNLNVGDIYSGLFLVFRLEVAVPDFFKFYLGAVLEIFDLEKIIFYNTCIV